MSAVSEIRNSIVAEIDSLAQGTGSSVWQTAINPILFSTIFTAQLLYAIEHSDSRRSPGMFSGWKIPFPNPILASGTIKNICFLLVLFASDSRSNFKKSIYD